MVHYPATYPSQIFFLKENCGYEIVVLYEGEQSLLRLLQPQEDLKYIIVLPHISMAARLRAPGRPLPVRNGGFSGSGGTGGNILFGGGRCIWKQSVRSYRCWIRQIQDLRKCRNRAG